MARKPRIDAIGVLYHILARGNNRQLLFRADADRERYLAILADAQRRFAVRVYAYVLMPNHVHILLELTAGTLAKCMQVIQQRYAQYINRKYRRVGHLYQGRYRAIVCERDQYLVALVRYLHLNPVRAGMVPDPAKYPWSSHLIYQGRGTSPIAINTGPVLGTFDPDVPRARRAYARFIKEGVGIGRMSEFYAVLEQQILGDERFAEEVSRPREIVRRRANRPGIGLEDLMEQVSRATHVPVALIKGRSRRRNIYRARCLLCYTATSVAGLPARKLAEALNRDPSSISRAVAWAEGMELKHREQFLRLIVGQG